MLLIRVGLLSLLVLLCGGAACTRSTSTAEADVPRLKSRRQDRARFDAAALVGQNIDQLRQQLGAPHETRQSAAGLEPTAAQLQTPKAEAWVNTFDQDGLTIVVTFNARTRAVRDLVLLGHNEDELIRRAGLNYVGDGYLVLPVPSPTEPSKLLGVRVVAR